MTKQIALGTGLALLLGVTVSGIAPRPAAAGPTGRRNTTIGLGVGTAVAAATGHKEAAIVLGAGTVASYVSYQNAVNAKRREAKAQRSTRVAAFRSTASSSSGRTAASRPVSARGRAGTRVWATSAPAPAGMRQIVTIRQPAPVADPSGAMPAAPVSSSAGFPAWLFALLGGIVLSALGYGLYRGLQNKKATA
jgi:hypothetical protein